MTGSLFGSQTGRSKASGKASNASPRFKRPVERPSIPAALPASVFVQRTGEPLGSINSVWFQKSRRFSGSTTGACNAATHRTVIETSQSLKFLRAKATTRSRCCPVTSIGRYSPSRNKSGFSVLAFKARFRTCIFTIPSFHDSINLSMFRSSCDS